MSTNEQILLEKNGLERLALNLREAEALFRMYLHLLKMKSNRRRFDVYKNTLVLFHYMQNALLDGFIIKISKLLDRAETGRNKNLTLKYFNELYKDIMNDVEKEKVSRLIEFLDENSKLLKTIRDKEIAHQDRNIKDRKEVYSEKIKVIRKILNKMKLLLEIYQKLFITKVKLSMMPIYFERNLGKDFRFLFKSMFFYCEKSNEEMSIKTESQIELDKKIMKDMMKVNFSAYVEREKEIR